MKNTTNFNLKKPDYNDIVDIADINSNMDIIDAELKKKVDTTVINELKVELANSKEIEKKVDKIVGGTAGTILLQKEDGGIKSSNVQIQELVKETKLTAEVGKLIPKVSNATNNKIAILNSDGTLKQGNKTIEEILNSTTWNNIQGKPNNLATTENIATAKNDLEDKINKKVEVAKSLSSKDLNTVYDVGFYSCSSCRNIPSGANGYASLIVMKGDSTITSNSTTDTVQIYIDANTKMYIRDCIDKNNSWDSWKEQVNTDLTGQLNGLRTNNKTNLVNAINEVFQLGTDRGNIIKNKVGALAGKTMQNMGDVADELEKYDVKYVLEECIVFANHDNIYSSIKIIDDYSILSERSGSKLHLINLNTQSVISYPDGFKEGSINYSNPLAIITFYNGVKIIDFLSKTYKEFKMYGNDFIVYNNKEKLYIFSENRIDVLEPKTGRQFNIKEGSSICGNSRYICINYMYDSNNIYVYDVNNLQLVKTINISESLQGEMYMFENSDRIVYKANYYTNLLDIKTGKKIKSVYGLSYLESEELNYSNGLITQFKGYDKLYLLKILSSKNLNSYQNDVKTINTLDENFNEETLYTSFGGRDVFSYIKNNYIVDFLSGEHIRIDKLTKTLKKVRD